MFHRLWQSARAQRAFAKALGVSDEIDIETLTAVHKQFEPKELAIVRRLHSDGLWVRERESQTPGG
eukprot:15449139-Alexandrium_andersonii.AAC.1